MRRWSRKFGNEARSRRPKSHKLAWSFSDALEAVHSAGLLHRDVKPQNVMRDRAGRLVLMDFGSGHDAQRFAASTVEGTPLYAAPEVLNGEEASVRSDIYSLGVLLWYLLTASYPVNGRIRGRNQARPCPRPDCETGRCPGG